MSLISSGQTGIKSEKMPRGSQALLISFAILFLLISAQNSLARLTSLTNKKELKSAVFLSPKFVLEPGSVSNKFYYNIDIPRGHIAIKSFNAEVVDKAGNPVPLHETYLHHWAVLRYYQRKGVEFSKYKGDFGFHQSDFIILKNAGLCDNGLPQFFGLGSETRRTNTFVPDPYGIEVGNEAEILSGYEERWLLNVHAIDTRAVEDRLGCTECRCDLYNVTKDEYGRSLRPDYLGGLNCCYDGTRCRVRKSIEKRDKRSLYMRYTVKWVDWDSSIVPVKIYLLDVTDTWKRLGQSTGVNSKHDCQIEYEIEPCAAGVDGDGCIDTKKVSLSMPIGGDVIYGGAHQHTGGIGSALYGEDGRVICSSMPIYGKGNEAGNEAGYIVGMSTCYPQPGSVKISNGEILILESNYSSSQRHTGVMGLFYLLVADSPPKRYSFIHSPDEMHGKKKQPNFVWGEVLFGVALALTAVYAYRRRRQSDNGYESIMM